MKPYNFYAGPAILPEEVLQKAQDAIKNFAGTGLSILEISHRSKEFVKVMDEARALVKELMQLNDEREVLFMHGGGLSQFHTVPMNLLNEDETASYFDTGTWAHGAVEEAKLFGNVHIACSSADKNYTYVPKSFSVAPNSKYLHITTNNTIYGTQLNLTPNPSPVGEGSNYFQGLTCPLVADMSSDIFSRELDYNQFDLIYAAAQKNAGAAGVTIVVVNKNILGTVKRKIPRMLNYRLHIEKESMLNTPSVFAVYVSYLTLQWIKKEGIKNIEVRNKRKAEKLYNAIDASALFEGTVNKEDRSVMNVCFRLNDTALEEKFVAFCKERNIVGIKGHRTVGGFRASMYNALPEEAVDVLAEAVKEFEQAF
ncbi:MAG: 3-phosphoserine/phosphohydroxythreonine transaminase [Chitinophagales bacterium]|nr:3-phosphoserine/phosphohydroxythreonine transaminase [Chitinophagales bacterium]